MVDSPLDGPISAEEDGKNGEREARNHAHDQPRLGGVHVQALVARRGRGTPQLGRGVGVMQATGAAGAAREVVVW